MAYHPIDVTIGKRVRTAREAVGKTQKELAADLGTSFQQVQKYETGANRLSASRLVHCADALDTTVAELFDGISTKTTASAGDHRNAVRLMKLYKALQPTEQRAVMTVARALRSSDNGGRSGQAN